MTEYSIRPYVDEDAETIAHIENAIRVRCGAEPAMTATDTRSLVGAWIRDRSTDTRVVLSRNGAVVAGGFVMPPPEGGERASIYAGVHPDAQGRSIGRDLMTWQLDRVRDIHAQLAPGHGWHIETGASADNAPAIRLFERRGFEPVRYFFDMVAPLNGSTPAVELPDGIASMPYAEHMSRALYDAHMEAFEDHWGFQRRPYERWIIGSVGAEDFRPDLSRIAFDGDEIAAYVLAYDGINGREYIGQVGTRRPWRKRGLASALIAESLVAGAEAGKSDASLGVDAANPTGAVGVYERLGFAVNHKFVTYQRSLE